MNTIPSGGARRPLAAVWREHPIAMTMMAVLGIAVSAAFFAASQYLNAPDEPPIRIKNGSLDLEIPPVYGPWKQDGDPRHWKTSGKTRRGAQIRVFLTPGAGVTCSSASATGDALTVTYSDRQAVTVDGKNKQTHVIATADLSPAKEDHVLSYKSAGFISEISLDGTSLCRFKAATELTDVWIFD